MVKDPSERDAPGLAVVTGAGTGIGRAVALRLASTGAPCVLVGRRLPVLRDTVRLIEDAGGSARAVTADLRAPSDRERVIADIQEGRDRWSVLVNNAGGSAVHSPWAPSVKQWREEFELNVEAAAFLGNAALKAMSDHGGSIVHVASVYGHVALNSRWYPDSYGADESAGRALAYTPSKAAVIALAKDQAVVGARFGVRVNSVSPGMIAIPERPLPDATLAELRRATPMGRCGTPQEVAGAVAFLCSADASFITGTDLLVDGGWSAW